MFTYKAGVGGLLFPNNSPAGNLTSASKMRSKVKGAPMKQKAVLCWLRDKEDSQHVNHKDCLICRSCKTSHSHTSHLSRLPSRKNSHHSLTGVNLLVSDTGSLPKRIWSLHLSQCPIFSGSSTMKLPHIIQDDSAKESWESEATGDIPQCPCEFAMVPLGTTSHTVVGKPLIWVHDFHFG